MADRIARGPAAATEPVSPSLGARRLELANAWAAIDAGLLGRKIGGSLLRLGGTFDVSSIVNPWRSNFGCLALFPEPHDK
jgi:hypothetical protein